MKYSMILVIFSFLGATTVNADQAYKWTDANGVTHFSDSPPPKDVDKSQVSRREIANASTTEVPDSQNASSISSAEMAAGSAAEISPAGQLAQACATARSQVDLLESKHQIVMEREGKNEQLDDTARQAELAKAQERVAAYCK